MQQLILLFVLAFRCRIGFSAGQRCVGWSKRKNG